MIWNTAYNIIDNFSKESDFGIIFSYVSEIRLIKDIKRNTEQLLLVSDNVEDFISDDSLNFKFIPSRRLSFLDLDKSFHPKIFLFAKKAPNNKYSIDYLIGSCNATFKGLNSNIEFYYSSNCVVENKTPFPLFNILSEGIYGPEILNDITFHNDNNNIVKSIFGFILQIVNEASGLNTVPPQMDAENTQISLSGNNAKVFIHSLNENSLFHTYKESIKSVITKSKEVCYFNLISPYIDANFLYELKRTIQEYCKNTYKKVKVKLITNYPPHFGELYSGSSVINLGDIDIINTNIDFEYKYWTDKSTIYASDIDIYEYKDIKNKYLHGKMIFLTNDVNNVYAIIGSPNLTSPAINISPKRNVECGIVFTGDEYYDDFNTIFHTLWDSSERPTEGMKDFLTLWLNSRDDSFLSTEWIESSTLFEKKIEIKILCNNNYVKDEVKLFDFVKCKFEIKITNEELLQDIEQIKIIFLTDKNNDKWEKVGYELNGIFYVDINPSDIIIYPCRLYYKILIKTKLKNQYTCDDITNIFSLLNLNLYDIKYYDDINKRFIEFDTNNVMDDNKKRVIRTYSKVAEYTSIKWKSISVCHKRPFIEPIKKIKCSDGICIKLNEKIDMNASKILLETINISLSRSIHGDYDKILKIESLVPYNAEFFYQNHSSRSDDVKLKIKYLDGNSHIRNNSIAYQLYDFTMCNDECDFKNNANHFINYCKNIGVEITPENNMVVEHAPIKIKYDLVEDSYIKRQLKQIKIQCSVISYGLIKNCEYLVEIHPQEKFTLFEVNPEKLLKNTTINKQDYKLATVKIKMKILVNSGWEYEFYNDSLDINNTILYINQHYIMFWKKCKSILSNKVELKASILQLLYNKLNDMNRINTSSIKHFTMQYEWDFEYMKDIGLNKKGGFLFNDADLKDIITQISNYIIPKLYDDFIYSKANPQIPFPYYKKILATIINDKIIDESCMLWESQTLLFPSDFLRKIL